MIFHIIYKTVSRQDNLTTLKAQKAEEGQDHYLFIMGNQLGLHMARHKVHSPQHLPCLQPPDGTSCINAGGTWKQSVQSVADRSEVPRQAALLVPTHQFSTGDHVPQTLPSIGRVPGEPQRVKFQSLS